MKGTDHMLWIRLGWMSQMLDNVDTSGGYHSYRKGMTRMGQSYPYDRLLRDLSRGILDIFLLTLIRTHDF